MPSEGISISWDQAHSRSATDRAPMRTEAQDMLARIWESAEPDLARLACALGVDRASVPDVLQEVYLAAYRSGPATTDSADLRRWLVRVTANRCRLEHRRRRRWLGLFQRLVGRRRHQPDVPSAAVCASQCEEREVVREALAGLDPEARVVLVLRYFMNYDSKEIGGILGVADSTVRGRLQAARRELARALGDRGGEQ